MAIQTRPRDDTRARRLVAAGRIVFGLSFALFLGAVLLFFGPNGGRAAPSDWGLDLGGLGDVLFSVAMFIFSIVGVLVTSRHPRNAVGWILQLIGLSWSLSALLSNYETLGLATDPGSVPRPDVSLLFSQSLWIPSVGLIGTYLVLLFPDGRLPSERWRWLGWFSGVAMVAPALVITFGTETFIDMGYPEIRNPLALQLPETVEGLMQTSFAGMPLAFIGCAAALVTRFRRSRGTERLQMKWLAAAVLTTASIFAVAMAVSVPYLGGGRVAPFWVLAVQSLSIYAFILVPIAVGIAMLRYRLFDIDLVINRTLVYGILSVFVVAIYAAIVLVFDRALSERISFGPALLATAVVALAFAPARERVQGRVDRVLYGERRDPYRVVSSLTTRLEASLALDEVMPAVVESVATALRLPWAEVRVHGGVEQAVWTHGDKGDVEESFPLHYRGEPVGELAVGPRRGEDRLDPSDRKLLEHLAAQAGAAAHAVSLTQALQRSRQRLVTTREEERRRLRRDLHDGLGPELTAVAMKIDLIRKTLADDPEQADELLEQLRGQVKAAIDDIRRLVYDLRPPALDELGLVGALRQQAAHFSGNGHGLSITIDAADGLPNLSAATEVAAFRIVAEAMTNAARHSEATSCDVRIALHDGLLIEVTDDGRWKPNRAGVGISSMRERAQELGGSCEVGPSEEGGARVVALLPIDSA